MADTTNAAAVPVARRPSLAILITVSALGPFALNVFLPSMGSMIEVFGTDYATAQLTLTLFLLAMACGQLMHGPLSDRFGRRPVLLSGIALYVAGSIVCAVAPTIGILLIGRVLQALGGCAGIVLGRAIVRDLYDREQAASMIGYVTMGFVVAPMVAPTVGGLMHDSYGWRGSFVLCAMLGLAVLIYGRFALFETLRQRIALPGPRGLAHVYGSLLGSTAFMGYALSSALTSATFFAFLAGAPYIMFQLLQRPASEFGFYFFLNALAYMVGNFLAGRFSARIGTDRMILTGGLIALCGVLLALGLHGAGFRHPFALFGPISIVALANGVLMPNAMAAAVSINPALAGTASGLAGALQMGIGALVTLITGHLLDDSAAPMILIMLVAAVLSFIAHAIAYRAQRKRKQVERVEAAARVRHVRREPSFQED